MRVPGRVNLIGEHIDYNGLPVMPLAIDRWVTMVLRRRDDQTVTIRNADPRYGGCTFELSSAIKPAPQGDWSNYPRAAAQAMASRHPRIRGMDVMIGSTIPPAMGLSSSSALVVASALALLAANDLPIDRPALMDRLPGAERYVGVAGGGMDQAICLGATAGAASLIRFDPLSLEAIPIPAAWSVVVASSLVRAEKSAGARAVYNRRTEECRQALTAVWRSLGLAGRPRYRDLVGARAVDELVAAGARCLEPVLLKRFRHVVTEHGRVARAVAALRTRDLNTMGGVLSASHTSLRDDYEVSCTELDRLVSIALEGGAAGARLTGAGLGGCAVAVVPRDGAGGLIERLDRDFYRGLEPGEPRSSVRFVAAAVSGAEVVPL